MTQKRSQITLKYESIKFSESNPKTPTEYKQFNRTTWINEANLIQINLSALIGLINIYSTFMRPFQVKLTKKKPLKYALKNLSAIQKTLFFSVVVVGRGVPYRKNFFEKLLFQITGNCMNFFSSESYKSVVCYLHCLIFYSYLTLSRTKSLNCGNENGKPGNENLGSFIKKTPKFSEKCIQKNVFLLFSRCSYDRIESFQQLPTQVVDIRSMGQRIVVSDSQESVHFMRYKKQVPFSKQSTHCL